MPQLVARIGFGNDIHRLVAGRRLVLGGVNIPFAKGPLGHSDGDALIHALCDALLGAAALGDIGQHFPNRAAQWKNAPSIRFLRHVGELLRNGGYEVLNLDATIELERPKLARYVPRMRRNLAAALGVSLSQVSVKAKTGEGLGAIGRGEAVRATAVALLQKS
jgi:2-C-methyl-D-erythritol 2,4-cyclodiphosphate synthase